MAAHCGSGSNVRAKFAACGVCPTMNFLVVRSLALDKFIIERTVESGETPKQQVLKRIVFLKN